MIHSDWNNSTFWASTLLGVAAALAVLLVGGMGWLAWLLALALLLAGAGLGWWQYQQHHQQRMALLAEFLAGQREFSEKVTPVWAGHINNSRTQMETAITALTLRFSEIGQRL